MPRQRQQPPPQDRTNGQHRPHGFDPTDLRRTFGVDGSVTNEDLMRFVANLDDHAGAFLSSRSEFFSSFFERGHKVESECGWPDPSEMTPNFYRSIFDRDSLAARVVEVLPKETWAGAPTVYEKERGDQATPFEQAWDDMVNQLSTLSARSWHVEEKGSPVWEHLLRADIISGIGQFGVILLGIDDGRNLQDPVDGVEAVANVRIGGRTFREILPDSPPHPDEVAAAQNAINNGGIPITHWVQKGEVNEIARIKVEPLPPDPWQRPDPDFLTANAGRAEPWHLWDRETQAMVLTDRGRLIVNRRDGSLVENEHNRMTINKVTREVDPYLGRTTLPRAGSPGGGPFVQGTDRQYSQGFGLGMPAPIGEIDGGPSLSGTDQQYFGVQFGPSEAFSEEPAKAGRKLLFLRCFDESLVQIVRYEWNIRNPRFGLPVMYRITLNDPRQPHSGVGLPLATVYVHWSRVIHVADNLLNSEIFGFPRLKQVLPEVLDRRKVRGAGAEGYWQSCFPGISFETHPTLGGDAIVDQAGIRGMMTAYRERLQRWLVLSGMSAKTLAPSVVDPTPHLAACIEAICVKLACPVPVFKGYEIGEQASENNDESWADVKRSRQTNYITPKIICPFVDRLIQIGVLPEPGGNGKEQIENLLSRGGQVKGRTTRRDFVTGNVVRGTLIANAEGTKTAVVEDGGYRVDWPDVETLGKKDKAAVALQTTQALVSYVQGNVAQIVPEHNYLTTVLGWSDEEAEANIKEAQKDQEEEEQANQDLADEHGFEPQPPPGFRNPKPPPGQGFGGGGKGQQFDQGEGGKDGAQDGGAPGDGGPEGGGGGASQGGGKEGKVGASDESASDADASDKSVENERVNAFADILEREME